MTLNGTMRGVVWEGMPFEMPIRSLPIPTLLAETDALIRVTASAICGSDLHIYRGLYGSPEAPWTMGHEGMGYVLQVGEAVSHVEVGDYGRHSRRHGQRTPRNGWSRDGSWIWIGPNLG